MKVTISDVARLAGVSTATVSHTINNTRYVSGETRERVYRAIRELGYTQDASSRGARTGRRETVGFIVPDVSNKFFGTMIEAMERYLAEQGYHLLIANTREDPQREERYLRLLTAGAVDGLLVASTMENFRTFDSLIPTGFPLVLVDRVFEEKKYSSVSVSSFQAIYRSVCRLAARGRKRVGFLGGLPRLSSTQERLSAYLQAVEDCALAREEGLIRCGDSMEKSAARCLEDLLEENCDAVVVCQGLMALETIYYFQKRDIRLSEDLDLVSFMDYDSELYDLYASRMDCIIQPVEEIGRSAGEQILKRIHEPEGLIIEKVLTSAYQPRTAAE